MALARTFKLNTGALIPAIGVGAPAVVKNSTYSPHTVQYKVEKFLKLGHRHIDTAIIYTNDQPLGRAIITSKVKREEIFLTQKLWNNQHQPELVMEACKNSLERSKLDYYDLFLMHWPIAFKDSREKKSPETEENKEEKKSSETKEIKENLDKTSSKPRHPIEIDDSIDFLDTYHAMESLVESGKVKAIGVANFGIKRLEKLLKKAKIPPAVNQVELHPYLPQNELLKFCKSKNIHVTAYSPFGVAGSALRTDEVINKIAVKHNKSIQQVLSSWAAQRGTSVVAAGINNTLAEQIFQDFVLPDEDFKEINELSKTKQERYITRKNWNFEWD
ncbi:391_t:CDS:2 [Ambispora gerdemannii]|uniref:391_t:CDS:1 n=1 Tax=Ambispora gerdemannii TaxID=144530 RepID=A0A9N8YMY0_9GLOM|nr:391_t:CDS:2 [Ambispora gerdemannii]